MNLSELKLGSLVEQISSVIKSREVPLPVEGVNVEGLPFRDGPPDTSELLKARRAAVANASQVFGPSPIEFEVDVMMENVAECRIERNTTDFAYSVLIPFYESRLNSLPLQKYKLLERWASFSNETENLKVYSPIFDEFFKSISIAYKETKYRLERLGQSTSLMHKRVIANINSKEEDIRSKNKSSRLNKSKKTDKDKEEAIDSELASSLRSSSLRAVESGIPLKVNLCQPHNIFLQDRSGSSLPTKKEMLEYLIKNNQGTDKIFRAELIQTSDIANYLSHRIASNIAYDVSSKYLTKLRCIDSIGRNYILANALQRFSGMESENKFIESWSFSASSNSDKLSIGGRKKAELLFYNLNTAVTHFATKCPFYSGNSSIIKKLGFLIRSFKLESDINAEQGFPLYFEVEHLFELIFRFQVSLETMRPVSMQDDDTDAITSKVQLVADNYKPVLPGQSIYEVNFQGKKQNISVESILKSDFELLYGSNSFEDVSMHIKNLSEKYEYRVKLGYVITENLSTDTFTPAHILRTYFYLRTVRVRIIRYRLLRILNFYASVQRKLSHDYEAVGKTIESFEIVNDNEPNYVFFDDTWEFGFDSVSVMRRNVHIIYASAVNDFKSLEEELLKISTQTILDTKTKYSSGVSNSVDAIDREEVLSNILECELQYQVEKLAIVRQMLKAYSHAVSPDNIWRMSTLIREVIHSRPRGLLNTTYYFAKFYCYEVSVLSSFKNILSRLMNESVNFADASITLNVTIENHESPFLFHSQWCSTILDYVSIKDSTFRKLRIDFLNESTINLISKIAEEAEILKEEEEDVKEGTRDESKNETLTASKDIENIPELHLIALEYTLLDEHFQALPHSIGNLKHPTAKLLASHTFFNSQSVFSSALEDVSSKMTQAFDPFRNVAIVNSNKKSLLPDTIKTADPNNSVTKIAPSFALELHLNTLELFFLRDLVLSQLFEADFLNGYYFKQALSVGIEVDSMFDPGSNGLVPKAIQKDIKISNGNLAVSECEFYFSLFPLTTPEDLLSFILPSSFSSQSSITIESPYFLSENSTSVSISKPALSANQLHREAEVKQWIEDNNLYSVLHPLTSLRAVYSLQISHNYALFLLLQYNNILLKTHISYHKAGHYVYKPPTKAAKDRKVSMRNSVFAAPVANVHARNKNGFLTPTSFIKLTDLKYSIFSYFRDWYLIQEKIISDQLDFSPNDMSTLLRILSTECLFSYSLRTIKSLEFTSFLGNAFDVCNSLSRLHLQMGNLSPFKLQLSDQKLDNHFTIPFDMEEFKFIKKWQDLQDLSHDPKYLANMDESAISSINLKTAPVQQRPSSPTLKDVCFLRKLSSWSDLCCNLFESLCGKVMVMSVIEDAGLSQSIVTRKLNWGSSSFGFFLAKGVLGELSTVSSILNSLNFNFYSFQNKESIVAPDQQKNPIDKNEDSVEFKSDNLEIFQLYRFKQDLACRFNFLDCVKTASNYFKCENVSSMVHYDSHVDLESEKSLSVYCNNILLSSDEICKNSFCSLLKCQRLMDSHRMLIYFKGIMFLRAVAERSLSLDRSDVVQKLNNHHNGFDVVSVWEDVTSHSFVEYLQTSNKKRANIFVQNCLNLVYISKPYESPNVGHWLNTILPAVTIFRQVGLEFSSAVSSLVVAYPNMNHPGMLRNISVNNERVNKVSEWMTSMLPIVLISTEKVKKDMHQEWKNLNLNIDDIERANIQDATPESNLKAIYFLQNCFRMSLSVCQLRDSLFSQIMQGNNALKFDYCVSPENWRICMQKFVTETMPKTSVFLLELKHQIVEKSSNNENIQSHILSDNDQNNFSSIVPFVYYALRLPVLERAAMINMLKSEFEVILCNSQIDYFDRKLNTLLSADSSLPVWTTRLSEESNQPHRTISFLSRFVGDLAMYSMDETAYKKMRSFDVNRTKTIFILTQSDVVNSLNKLARNLISFAKDSDDQRIDSLVAMNDHYLSELSKKDDIVSFLKRQIEYLSTNKDILVSNKLRNEQFELVKELEHSRLEVKKLQAELAAQEVRIKQVVQKEWSQKTQDLEMKLIDMESKFKNYRASTANVFLNGLSEVRRDAITAITEQSASFDIKAKHLAIVTKEIEQDNSHKRAEEFAALMVRMKTVFDLKEKKLRAQYDASVLESNNRLAENDKLWTQLGDTEKKVKSLIEKEKIVTMNLEDANEKIAGLEKQIEMFKKNMSGLSNTGPSKHVNYFESSSESSNGSTNEGLIASLKLELNRLNLELNAERAVQSTLKSDKTKDDFQKIENQLSKVRKQLYIEQKHKDELLSQVSEWKKTMEPLQNRNKLLDDKFHSMEAENCAIKKELTRYRALFNAVNDSNIADSFDLENSLNDLINPTSSYSVAKKSPAKKVNSTIFHTKVLSKSFDGKVGSNLDLKMPHVQRKYSSEKIFSDSLSRAESLVSHASNFSPQPDQIQLVSLKPNLQPRPPSVSKMNIQGKASKIKEMKVLNPVVDSQGKAPAATFGISLLNNRPSSSNA